MKTLRAIAIWTVFIIVGLFLIRGAERSGDHYRKAALAKVAAKNEAIYDRGFWDGFRATLKNITFNTNNATFSLEITNVMNQMKP